MFKLSSKAPIAGNPPQQPAVPLPFYSDKLPSGKPPGVQRVLSAINKSRVITEGHITPKMPPELCLELREQTNIYDAERLCKRILRNCGFDASGFDLGRLLTEPVLVNDYAIKDNRGRFVGDERMVQYAMLLQAMQIVLLSYGDLKRLSGNPCASHSLRAGAFAAAIGAPIEIVISSILHDILEDSLDKDMPGVKYRAYVSYRGKPQLVEYESEQAILHHIRENFWRYGRKIAWDVRCDTRLKKSNGGWEPEYQSHIALAHSRIGSAFSKGADSYVNLQELEPGSDILAMAAKLERKLLKVDWQVPFWNKMSWVISEILLHELKQKAKGTKFEGIEKKHRFITSKEIRMVRRGFNNLFKSHAFSPELVKNLSRSRSPIIDIYVAKPMYDGAKCSYKFEFPFIQEKETAFGLVKDVFGKRMVGEPARATSMLPSRLTDAVIVWADFASEPKLSEVSELVLAYDGALQGILHGGFDRKALESAARERRARLKSELGLKG